jgi:disulfide bond formation protein DsbB
MQRYSRLVEKNKVMRNLSYFVYHKISADLFLIISTALLASLWTNNGLSFFKEFDLFPAFILNTLCLIPVFWGFWIARKLQEIDKKIIYSLDNNTRRSIKEAEEEVNKTAEDFISNNSPYKNIGLHTIVWSVIVILAIILICIYIVKQR